MTLHRKIGLKMVFLPYTAVIKEVASVVPGIYRIAAAVRTTPCCFLGCSMFCFDYQLPHKTNPYTHGHGMSKVVIFGRRNAIFDDEDAIYLPQPDSVL